MPTYEYECEKCGQIFECYQGINDKPLSKCPECGGRASRLIGGGILLVDRKSGAKCSEPT